MPTTEDLIDLALAQQPTSFAAALNDVLSMKAAAAVEELRPEVAAGMFADEEEPEDEEYEDGEEDDEDELELDDDFEDEDDWVEGEEDEDLDNEDEDGEDS